LKITGRLDHKLRHMDIPFYYTFLNGEGSEALKRYCEITHKNSGPDTPLFVTKGDKPVNQRWVWAIVKKCAKRAGYDPGAMWTHTLRKAFRKEVRHSDTDEEFKEQIMGHLMRGSREAYFDRHDLSWFIEQYQKINFGREAVGSETARMKLEMEQKLRQKDTEISKLVEEMRGFHKTNIMLKERIEELQFPTEQRDALYFMARMLRTPQTKVAFEQLLKEALKLEEEEKRKKTSEPKS